MSEPIYSPDGKWMWSGTEWIPVPPKSSESSANVNLHDSVVGGDVNITHNEVNPDAIGEVFKKAMVSIKNEEMDDKKLQGFRDLTILRHENITKFTKSDYRELVDKLSKLPQITRDDWQELFNNPLKIPRKVKYQDDNDLLHPSLTIIHFMDESRPYGSENFRSSFWIALDQNSMKMANLGSLGLV